MRWGIAIRSALLGGAAVAFGPPAAVDDPALAALAPTVAFDPSAKKSFTDILTAMPKLQFRERIEVDDTLPGQSAALIDNLQSAVVSDPVSVQAEWFATTAQQTGRGGVYFQGAYDHGSLFLTGEHWGDDAARAGFGELAARNPMDRSVGGGVFGPSAVELAARFSVTNTTSHILPPGQPSTAFGAHSGTILYEESWGMNWYLNSYTRIMANYTFSVPTTHGSPALPTRTFVLRTAIWW
jgi:phosphate-selective porin